MNILDFKRRKKLGQKITVLTCYDFPSARTLAESNIDCALVGDSVAMAVHGHSTTLMADMEMMSLHTSAVARGIGKQFLVADLPFLCHRASEAELVRDVKRLMQAGAHGIKIEGADSELCRRIDLLVTAGIPIMGHIGLTPQSHYQLGGNTIQGRATEQAENLLQQALALQAAGCFALVIECVPAKLAAHITAALEIPTIGIGAGSQTDGQVLVWHDLLGLQDEFQPKFLKRYAKAKPLFIQALEAYALEVGLGQYPSTEHSFE